MDDKAELTLSINQAESLKRITTMPGWKIIEDFLNKYEQDSLIKLKDIDNSDIADIQSCRRILKFIKEFRDLIKYTEISAEEDERELRILNKKKGVISNGR